MITIFSMATRAVGFVNRIFLSRTIGAEGLGIYQVVCSVFYVLITITSSGLPIAVSKQTARLRAINNNDGGHSTVTAAALIGVSISLILTILIIVFKDYVSFLFADERCMPIFIVLLPGVTASAIYSSYRGGLWGQKNFFAFSLCEFLEEILLFATCIILVSQVSGIIAGVYNAAVAVSISYIASALIAICVYFYYDGKIKNPRGYMRPVINSAAPLTGLRVSSSIISSLLAIIIPLRLILSGLTSSEALSEFGIAAGMTLPLLYIPGTLVGSLALVLIPEISGKKDKSSKNISYQIENALTFAVMVSLAVFCFYFGAGKDIGIVMYDNARSGQFLIYGAAIMIPMSLTQMSSSILNTLGYEYKTLKNYTIGAVIMLLAVWFLPPLLGIYSMILGFFLSFTITAVLNTLLIIKKVKKSGIFLNSLPKLLIACMLSTSLCYLLNIIFKGFLPLILSLTFSGLLSISLFILICGIFKINNLDVFIKKIMLKRLTNAEK